VSEPEVTLTAPEEPRINAEFEHGQSLREHLAPTLLAVEMLPATLLREAFSGQV